MDGEQLEAGKMWVKEKLLEIANESDVHVSNVEWAQRGDDSDRFRFSLSFEALGRAHSKKFDKSDLQDAPGHNAISSKLESQIEDFIKSINPQSRKIGF